MSGAAALVPLRTAKLQSLIQHSLETAAHSVQRILPAHGFAIGAIAEPLEFTGLFCGDFRGMLLQVDALPELPQKRGFQVALSEGQDRAAFGIPLLLLHLFGREIRRHGGGGEGEAGEEDGEGEKAGKAGRGGRCAHGSIVS